MEQVSLAAGAVRTTRIGFGCAGLMRLPAPREREAVLRAAFDAGIYHFDVARMYGLGAAERELGRFAAGRRDSLVIATKFGIQPPTGAGYLAALQGPARALLSRHPGLRRRIKRGAGSLTVTGTYDAVSARASLETSLRELGTDRIDLLFLHAPTPDRVRAEDVCAYLEDARHDGLIGAWGVSGEPESTAAVMHSFSVRVVAQIHDDILSRSSRALAAFSAPWITFGALAGPLETIGAHLADPARAAAWSEAVGEDCGRPETLASLLLRDAVRVNRLGTVLFATTRPGRVAAAADAAAGADRPDRALDAFRSLVSRELSAC